MLLISSLCGKTNPLKIFVTTEDTEALRCTEEKHHTSLISAVSSQTGLNLNP
ncbi:MAG: hypothetical protein OFPII_32320 [Osedax symbiont Rs1]|nr:MAG: hypothetical protein OFPII_32320 [Osedax symbiont Rs1]